MTIKEKKKVQDFIDSEGFDYTFQHYTSFFEIKDAKFHDLRKAYLKASKELANYVNVEV